MGKDVLIGSLLLNYAPGRAPDLLVLCLSRDNSQIYTLPASAISHELDSARSPTAEELRQLDAGLKEKRENDAAKAKAEEKKKEVKAEAAVTDDLEKEKQRQAKIAREEEKRKQQEKAEREEAKKRVRLAMERKEKRQRKQAAEAKEKEDAERRATEEDERVKAELNRLERKRKLQTLLDEEKSTDATNPKPTKIPKLGCETCPSCSTASASAGSLISSSVPAFPPATAPAYPVAAPTPSLTSFSPAFSTQNLLGSLLSRPQSQGQTPMILYAPTVNLTVQPLPPVLAPAPAHGGGLLGQLLGGFGL
jgi:hypothetical protein